MARRGSILVLPSNDTGSQLSFNDAVSIVRRIASGNHVDDSVLNDGLAAGNNKVRTTIAIARLLKDRIDVQQHALLQKQQKISRMETLIARKGKECRLLAEGPTGELDLLEANTSELRGELRRLTREVEELQQKVDFHTQAGTHESAEKTALVPGSNGNMTKDSEARKSCRDLALVAETQGVLEHLKRQTHQTEMFSTRLIEEEHTLRVNLRTGADLEQSLTKRWREVMLQKEHDMVKFRVRQKVLDKRLETLVQEEEEESRRRCDKLAELEVLMAVEKQKTFITTKRITAKENAELDMHLILNTCKKRGARQEGLHSQSLVDTMALRIRSLERQLEEEKKKEVQGTELSNRPNDNVLIKKKKNLEKCRENYSITKVHLLMTIQVLKRELARKRRMLYREPATSTSFYLLINHTDTMEPVIPPALKYYLACAFNVQAHEVDIGEASYLRKEHVVFETMSDKDSDARSLRNASPQLGGVQPPTLNVIPADNGDGEVIISDGINDDRASANEETDLEVSRILSNCRSNASRVQKMDSDAGENVTFNSGDDHGVHKGSMRNDTARSTPAVHADESSDEDAPTVVTEANRSDKLDQASVARSPAQEARSENIEGSHVFAYNEEPSSSDLASVRTNHAEDDSADANDVEDASQAANEKKEEQNEERAGALAEGSAGDVDRSLDMLPDSSSPTPTLGNVPDAAALDEQQEVQAPVGSDTALPALGRRASANLTSLPVDPRKLQMVRIKSTRSSPLLPSVAPSASLAQGLRLNRASPSNACCSPRTLTVCSAHDAPSTSHVPASFDARSDITSTGAPQAPTIMALREALQVKMPKTRMMVASPLVALTTENSLEDLDKAGHHALTFDFMLSSASPSRRESKSPTAPSMLLSPRAPPADAGRRLGKTKTLGVPMIQRRLVPARSLASPTAGVHKFELLSPRLMRPPPMSPALSGMHIHAGAPPVSPAPNLMASPLPLMSPSASCRAASPALPLNRTVMAAPPASPVFDKHASAMDTQGTVPGLVQVKVTLDGVHPLHRDVADTALRDLHVTDIIWAFGAPSGPWEISTEEYIGQRRWVFESTTYDVVGYWCRSLKHLRVACSSAMMHISHQDLIELLGSSRLVQDDFRHLLLDALLPFLWFEDGQLVLLRFPKTESDSTCEESTEHTVLSERLDPILLEELLVVPEESPKAPRFFAMRVTRSHLYMVEPGMHGLQEGLSFGPLGVQKACRREFLFPRLTFLVSVHEDALCQLRIHLRLVGYSAHSGWRWRIQPRWRDHISEVLHDNALVAGTAHTSQDVALQIEPTTSADYLDYEHEGTQVIYRATQTRAPWVNVRAYRVAFRTCRFFNVGALSSRASSSIWLIDALESSAQTEFVLHCTESSTCEEAFLVVDSIELYKAFRGKRKYEADAVSRRLLAQDLVERVQLARDNRNGGYRAFFTKHHAWSASPESASHGFELDSPDPAGAGTELDHALPKGSVLFQQECERRLTFRENILAQGTLSVLGKRSDITVLNDVGSPEGLTCVHAFLIILRRSGRYYATQINDYTLREVLGPSELFLLQPLGRIELAEKLLYWVNLRAPKGNPDGELRLVVDPLLASAAQSMGKREHDDGDVWPLDAGSEEMDYNAWQELREDSPPSARHEVLVGTMKCEVVLRVTKGGYQMYVCVHTLKQCTNLHMPAGGSNCPTRVYMEHRKMGDIPFVFLLVEQAFPHTITLHAIDALTYNSGSFSVTNNEVVHSLCPLSYMQTLGLLGERLLQDGACQAKPKFENTIIGREMSNRAQEDDHGARVIRVLQTDLEPIDAETNGTITVEPMAAWSLLYSGTHRVDTLTNDDSHGVARTRHVMRAESSQSVLAGLLSGSYKSDKCASSPSINGAARGTHLNITVAKKPRTRDFSLTISASIVARSFRSIRSDTMYDRTSSDTATTTKNAPANSDTYTLELGDLGVSNPLNLFAEVRTLLGLPLLIFVMQDFTPHAARIAISALDCDWSFEVHVVHENATPYVQHNPNRHVLLHAFRHYFGQRQSQLTKLHPLLPKKKLLYRENVDDERGCFIFSMSLCDGDVPKLELRMMHCGGHEQVLLLEGDPLLVALSNCQVSLRHLEDTSDFVARSLLAALSVDETTGEMVLATQFSPDDALTSTMTRKNMVGMKRDS